MRKAKRKMKDAMIKYWPTANERVGLVLLEYVLVFLEGYVTVPGLRGLTEDG